MWYFSRLHTGGWIDFYEALNSLSKHFFEVVNHDILFKVVISTDKCFCFIFLQVLIIIQIVFNY